jgi:hypothetical protein
MDPNAAPLVSPPYSPFADWLSKFHMASAPIQALWILALTAVALATLWTLAAPFRLWLAALASRRADRQPEPRQPPDPQGELVYGVYRDRDGRWLVYAQGEVRAMEAERVERLEQ